MALVESGIQTGINEWQVAPQAEDPRSPEFYARARASAELFVANQRSHGTDWARIHQNALDMTMHADEAKPNGPVIELVACVEDELVRQGVSLLAHDIRKLPSTPRVQFPDAYASYLAERRQQFARTIFTPPHSLGETM